MHNGYLLTLYLWYMVVFIYSDLVVWWKISVYSSRFLICFLNWLGVLQVFMSLESTPDAMFRSDAVKYALIGVMRDLRGIAMATNRLVKT